MSRKRPGLTSSAGILAATVTAGLLAAAPAQAVAGDQAADGQYTFTAKLDIGNGDRACSGALVAPQWIITASSCFAQDPETSLEVPAGKPAAKTVATVGRTDLTDPTGHASEIVELVPRADRDLVLARMARPATGIQPVKISETTPATAETLTAAGYGRTDTVWVPNRLHTGTFTVDSVTTGSVGISGTTADFAICKGDTGGPLVRDTASGVELVAVNSRSWQSGCLGSEETRAGAVSSRLDDVANWIRATTTAATLTDFNCDGAEDVAVSDPKGAVDSNVNAGLVQVVYGDGKGTAQITQSLDYVPGGSEAGDQFGETLAVYDHNLDGCSDLVVGVPREDISATTDAGAVYVLYGHPDGIMKGQAALVLEQGKGAGGIAASVSEAGDQMGYSLAAGHTASGEPYLLIGVPGEKLGDVEEAGQAFYVRGDINRGVTQNKPGVAGGPQPGNRFGASVAASTNHIAIGVPGEVASGETAAGVIHVLQHELSSDGIPNPLTHISQDTPGINGGSEIGDEFGAAVAAIPYRPAGSPTATDSIIAVGVPGESHVVDGIDEADAGRFVTLHVNGSGTVSQLSSGSQNNTGVTGPAEAGDRFGEKLVAVNTSPNSEGTSETMLLAVGVPGENTDGFADAGVVQTFSLLGAAADSDFWVKAGNVSGLPGPVGADQRVGAHITATGTHLYIGMPHGPTARGAIHALPWSNATGDTTESVTSYEPGENGIPATGSAFGWAIQ